MPQGSDLLANGMPPGLANILGNQPQGLNAVGTVQSTAGLILTTLVSITASAGATAAVLPSTAPIGSPYFVASVGSTAAKIYAPSGQNMNGVLNGHITFAAAVDSAIFIQMSNGNWVSIPLAP